MAAEKNHVRYEGPLRLEAKAKRLGLVTVHVRFPDGTEHEYQCVATPDECRFAAWAGALVAEPRIRKIPDLQEMVRVEFPDEPTTQLQGESERCESTGT